MKWLKGICIVIGILALTTIRKEVYMDSLSFASITVGKVIVATIMFWLAFRIGRKNKVLTNEKEN